MQSKSIHVVLYTSPWTVNEKTRKVCNGLRCPLRHFHAHTKAASASRSYSDVRSRHPYAKTSSAASSVVPKFSPQLHSHSVRCLRRHAIHIKTIFTGLPEYIKDHRLPEPPGHADRIPGCTTEAVRIRKAITIPTATQIISSSCQIKLMTRTQ